MTANNNYFGVDCTVTPFDAKSGIWFKYGRHYTPRKAQLRELYKRFSPLKLPRDFRKLVGDYCEGGFDGFYRVYNDANTFVCWTHLMLMKLPDEWDDPDHDPGTIIEQHPSLFKDNSGHLRLFPFGEAQLGFKKDDRFSSDGFLAFDLDEKYCIRFLAVDTKHTLWIAKSFGDMMLRSEFLFFG